MCDSGEQERKLTNLQFQLTHLHPNESREKSWQSGYAYLIRSDLRMFELYPLIGEILFGSGPRLKETPKKNEQKNIIFFGIDDTRTTLFINLLKTKEGREDRGVIDRLKTENEKKNESFSLLPDQAFWVDTFGKFHCSEPDLKSPDNLEKTDSVTWEMCQVDGAGNPMNIFRVHREMVQKKTKAPLNLFFLHSLSNLYRNIGLRETAALLKSLLQDIWSGEEVGDVNEKGKKSSDAKDEKISRRDSLFIAVEQKGVMAKEESRYLESFFDGIIEVKAIKTSSYRLPLVMITALPGHLELPKPFIYISDKMKQQMETDDTVGKKMKQIVEELKSSKKYELSSDEWNSEGLFIHSLQVKKKPSPKKENQRDKGDT